MLCARVDIAHPQTVYFAMPPKKRRVNGKINVAEASHVRKAAERTKRQGAAASTSSAPSAGGPRHRPYAASMPGRRPNPCRVLTTHWRRRRRARRRRPRPSPRRRKGKSARATTECRRAPAREQSERPSSGRPASRADAATHGQRRHGCRMVSAVSGVWASTAHRNVTGLVTGAVTGVWCSNALLRHYSTVRCP